MLDELGFDHAVNLLDVLLVQCNKDCLLVRKVLIDRADTHTGNLGDPLCSDSSESLTLQYSPNSVEYGSGSPEETEAHVALWRAIREGRLGAVTDEVERILGRKPITLDQWLAENTGAFL